MWSFFCIFEADIGHILFLRILYHIPYHFQKSDILSYPKVDCSGKRLMVCWKIWGFWNSFSYKIVLKTCNIPWGNPYIVGQLYGVPHGILRVFKTLFYKKITFKILKLSNRPSIFFPSILLYITAKKRIGYYILYPYFQKFQQSTLF
jgi:hypothetical protein